MIWEIIDCLCAARGAPGGRYTCLAALRASSAVSNEPPLADTATSSFGAPVKVAAPVVLVGIIGGGRTAGGIRAGVLRAAAAAALPAIRDGASEVLMVLGGAGVGPLGFSCKINWDDIPAFCEAGVLRAAAAAALPAIRDGASEVPVVLGEAGGFSCRIGWGGIPGSCEDSRTADSAILSVVPPHAPLATVFRGQSAIRPVPMPQQGGSRFKARHDEFALQTYQVR